MKKINLSLSRDRQQIMTFALQQSLKILQSTQLELLEQIQGELEQNPLLEDRACKKSTAIPIDLAIKPSLRDHLRAQARERFTEKKELSMAFYLIDLIDEKGFLTAASSDGALFKKVLAILKTFDPPGIAAKNLQESFLTQLQNDKDQILKTLILNHYENLLHGRISLIQKSLQISKEELRALIDKLSKLRMNPIAEFQSEPPVQWIPDLIFQKKDQGWTIQVGQDELPSLFIRKEYEELKNQLKGEEKETLRSWVVRAKWFLRSISRRNEFLLKIGKLLLKMQPDYFQKQGPLTPIPIKQLAKRLNVHPTTAWRAISNKIVVTPQETLPLARFFSDASSDSAKTLLRRLIEKEDKANPYTDDALSELFEENGLTCARRTISKYRKELKIPSAHFRKTFG